MIETFQMEQSVDKEESEAARRSLAQIEEEFAGMAIDGEA